MIQERVARRYIAALRTASFIPDKFWKEKKAKLRTILTKTTKDNGPDDYSLAIMWELVPFLHDTKQELFHFGLNEYAEKTIDGYVDGMTEYLKAVAEKLDKFHQACVADPSAPRARDKVVWLIRWKREVAFEESVKTLSQALRYQWYAAAEGDEALADRMLSKATPDEIDAIVRDDALDNRSIHLRWGFLEKAGLDRIAKRTIKKSKLDWDPMDRFDGLRKRLESADYATIEHDDAFRDFMLGDMRIIIVDPKASRGTPRWYIRGLDRAKAEITSKGFGKLWYGTLFVKSIESEKLTPYEQKSYESLGYKRLEQTAGTYHSGADVVVITAPPDSRFTATIIHELGHRYWYKFMKPDQRARFNDLVGTNPSERSRDLPSGKTDLEGWKKPVSPVSDYGASTIEEAFAEAFEHYVSEGDMDRDQLESFRSVLGSDGSIYAKPLGMDPHRGSGESDGDPS